ncbi:15138_t:CDS:2 [Funneliformis mosseae]|uniref:15138_t:CDS:1 n=1 Tax=Funneliformis mosseae TaxID=27381 RepID=A0A9N9DVB5_FUNMO|nr:15138_t:CDS:2 [Funneliformis mosseae]
MENRDKIDDVYGEIFLALEGKADTLVHFITSFQDNDYILGFIPIKFSKFYNLKTLIINDSYVEYERQLKHLSYQNLEVFQIDFIKTSTLIYIINNSGGNLSKIIVGGCSYNGDEDLIIIRTIHEKCPLIEYLTLTFSSSDENFMEFEKLLNTCQKLKTLILNIDAFLSEGHSIAEKRLLSGEKLSKALIRSAPFNLRRLVFNGINHDYGPRFSFKTLKDFFENWKGRTSLSIFTPDRHYKAKEYDEMISGYLNDGVIKDFSYNLINYFM